MGENWIANIVGLMHINKVKQVELARELGISPQFLCSVLSGKRTSKRVQEAAEDAISNIVKRRSA